MNNFIKEFISPNKRFYPAVNWIWNSEITENGIKKNIREFKAAGFKSVLIMAEPKEFRPDSMATDLKPDYLSEEFFDLIRFAAGTISENGMSLWLYDEGGWPSGGACTRVVKSNGSFSAKSVAYLKHNISKGEIYQPVSDGHSVFLAAFVNNTHRIYGGDTVNSDATIFEYRVYSSVSLRNDFFRTDIADRHATDEFIRLTHSRYFNALYGDSSNFGKSAAIFFNDEPSLPENAWTPNLEYEFFQKYNYDILDYLPFIAGGEETLSENEIKAVVDYKLLLGELIKENYFIPIRNYCRKNGVSFGGHLDGEHDAYNFIHNMRYGNPMEILRSYDIPGIDTIWRQIFPSEKINAERRKCQIFPRYASSAARQIGKNTALSESFAVYGDGLTLDEMRYIVSSQAVRGINMFDFMVASYSTKKACALVERPSFAAEKPGFNNLRLINDYTARLCSISSRFKSTGDSALYLPVRDIAAGGNFGKTAATEFEMLAVILERKHIDFDIIDDCAIEKAALNSGCLCFGNATYRTVYIPNGIKYMPENVKKKLSKLSVSTERPIFDCNDENIVGRRLEDDDGNVLYLLFNCGIDEVKTTVGFNDKRLAYRFEAETGNIYYLSASCDRINLKISGGGIAAVLFTDKKIAAIKTSESQRLIASVENFKVRRLNEFFITESGITEKHFENEVTVSAKLGGWCDLYGRDFSGEVLYIAEFRLDALPENDYCIVDIGNVEYSAKIVLNGKEIGLCGMKPNRLRFESGCLSKNNILEISVSNTAANRIAATDIKSLWDKKYLGPYDIKTREFESENLGGGLLGPVKIYEV